MATLKNKDQSYSASDIQVLEGMEAVRRRPGMYIGSTDQRGIHQLIYEAVDNSVDEFMAGYCSRVEVDIDDDGVLNLASFSDARFKSTWSGTQQPLTIGRAM